jgi:hypothetical protein
VAHDVVHSIRPIQAAPVANLVRQVGRRDGDIRSRVVACVRWPCPPAASARGPSS